MLDCGVLCFMCGVLCSVCSVHYAVVGVQCAVYGARCQSRGAALSRNFIPALAFFCPSTLASLPRSYLGDIVQFTVCSVQCAVAYCAVGI